MQDFPMDALSGCELGESARVDTQQTFTMLSQLLPHQVLKVACSEGLVLVRLAKEVICVIFSETFELV